MLSDFWTNAVFSITPTVIIGLIFWFVMRAILRSDRTERGELEKYENEERARRAAQKSEK